MCICVFVKCHLQSDLKVRWIKLSGKMCCLLGRALCVFWMWWDGQLVYLMRCTLLFSAFSEIMKMLSAECIVCLIKWSVLLSSREALSFWYLYLCLYLYPYLYLCIVSVFVFVYCKGSARWRHSAGARSPSMGERGLLSVHSPHTSKIHTKYTLTHKYHANTQNTRK